MSAIVRSRFLSIISKNNQRRYSDITANPHKEPITSSSSSLLNNNSIPPPPPPDTSIPPPPPPPPPPSSTPAESKWWSFLKYTLVAALTGGVATAGYASYGLFLFSVRYLISFN